MFTGTQLCWGLFFNKVVDLQACGVVKKTAMQVFSCEHCKIFNNAFLFYDRLLYNRFRMNAVE